LRPEGPWKGIRIRKVWSVAFVKIIALAIVSDIHREAMEYGTGEDKTGHLVGSLCLPLGPDTQATVAVMITQLNCRMTNTGSQNIMTDGIQSNCAQSDGQILASGSETETIRLWNIGTGRCLQNLQGILIEFSSCLQSTMQLAVGTRSNLEAVECRYSHLIENASGPFQWVLFGCLQAPRGALQLVGTSKLMKLWNVDTESKFHKTYGDIAISTFGAFSPDGQILADGSRDHAVKIPWTSQQSSKCLKTYNWVSFDLILKGIS